jgi:hypothetical protein
MAMFDQLVSKSSVELPLDCGSNTSCWKHAECATEKGHLGDGDEPGDAGALI